MPIALTCPHCERPLQVGAASGVRWLICPHCAGRLPNPWGCAETDETVVLAQAIEPTRLPPQEPSSSVSCSGMLGFFGTLTLAILLGAGSEWQPSLAQIPWRARLPILVVGCGGLYFLAIVFTHRRNFTLYLVGQVILIPLALLGGFALFAITFVSCWAGVLAIIWR